MTKLEKFMRANRLGPMELVRRSGVSRRHLFYLRRGQSKPSLESAALIAIACSELTGKEVGISDLFVIETPARKRKAS